MESRDAFIRAAFDDVYRGLYELDQFVHDEEPIFISVRTRFAIRPLRQRMQSLFLGPQPATVGAFSQLLTEIEWVAHRAIGDLVHGIFLAARTNDSSMFKKVLEGAIAVSTVLGGVAAIKEIIEPPDGPERTSTEIVINIGNEYMRSKDSENYRVDHDDHDDGERRQRQRLKRERRDRD